MSSSTQDARVTMWYATRAMSEEALRLAAHAAAGSAEHDFYAGVASAADTHRRSGRAPGKGPGWLDRQTPAFRDGYLKASAVIAVAGSHPRSRLLVPSFEARARPIQSP